MKVLMFSSDRGAEERMRKYGEKLEKLEIIFFDRARGRLSRFFKGYSEAKKILSSEKFDLITAQEIEHSFIAYLLSKKFKVHWQMQLHTDVFSPYFWRESLLNKIRVRLAKFLIPRASCVRVVSERIKKSINRPDAVALPIFPNLKPQTSNFNLREKYPGYDFYILMVSRLTGEKNISLALEAMREIIKKYPSTLLVIVGDGPERKSLERKILDKLEASVRLEGWQDSLAGYYQSADIFLLTSNYEGYGLSVMEALRAGLPVVMTDVGIAGEIVKDGENGIVISVGDKTELVESILKLREDLSFRKTLSQAARKTQMPYQSFEEYRDRLIQSFVKCSQK